VAIDRGRRTADWGSRAADPYLRTPAAPRLRGCIPRGARRALGAAARAVAISAVSLALVTLLTLLTLFALLPAAVAAQAGGPAAATPGVPEVPGAPGVPLPELRVTAGTLRFDADATVGDFSGVTSAVTGELRAASVPGEVRGWVEAPVRSLRTGNRMRDGHMYTTLDAGRYPLLRFEAHALEAAVRGDSAWARLTGTLTIHGVSRSVTVPLTAARPRAGVLRIVGTFPLDVNDFGVSDGLVRMGGLLRVDPNVRIALDLTFAEEAPQAPQSLQAAEASP